MSDHRDFKFWVGFFIGGLVGAAVIVFLGTKEGKKLGNLLEKKGKLALDELEDKVDELKAKGEELVKKGEEIKEQVLEHVEEKKETLTEEATKRIETALASVEQIQAQGLSTTSNLRKRFKNVPKRS